MQTYINSLAKQEGQTVTLKGWVANKRESKTIVFLIFRDGSGFAQAIIDLGKVGEENFNNAKKLTLESSVELTGTVVKDERQVGGYELQVDSFNTISICEEYPIANKEHGVDFLMDKRYLWLRSKRQWAIQRVRNRVKWAIHSFFQERNFIQMDPPIFTGNACEGTTDLFETDFYGQPAYLSQSGQLYGEAMAMAHGLIYTFGPTFRAEKSKTRRHLSEFWMIEPEMAYYNLDQDMDVIEEFLKYVVSDVLENCKAEFELLERDTSALEQVAKPFPRITYKEAVAILRGEKEVDGKTSIQVLEADIAEMNATIEESKKEIEETEATLKQGGLKKGKLNYFRNKADRLKAEVKTLEERVTNIPAWIKSATEFEYGADLGGSDETVLTKLFGTPIMVYNWPGEIKAFYMKEDENDPSLAKGVDVLAPEGFGEIVGGGERETDVNKLIAKIKEHDLPMEEFEWYLDLRRYGSVPHAGFGLGLERLVSWVCNLSHIRETIPFPRSYGRLFP